MSYFRCRSIDRKQELARLRVVLEEDLKHLAPQKIVIRRIQSREQHCRSHETEIVVCFSSGRVSRTRIAKPIGAIGLCDLQGIRPIHACISTKE